MRAFGSIRRLSYWDAFAFIVLMAVVMGVGLLLSAHAHLVTPGNAIDLHPFFLPYYALRSVFRMFIGLLLSVITTFVLGTWMVKSERAERVLLPLVDVLQSVPVLAFLQMAIWGFGSMMSDPVYAFEFAAILAIYTSQVWNMILAFYQSLKGFPHAWMEMAQVYQLSSWRRFWQLEVPFALPELVSNTMMSLSAGWFFVVASEAITTHGRVTYLPGLGSYIHQASAREDATALYYAVLALFIVILLYDQCFFRPVNYWLSKRENVDYAHPPWVLRMVQGRAWLQGLLLRASPLWESWLRLFPDVHREQVPGRKMLSDILYGAIMALFFCVCLWILWSSVQEIAPHEALRVMRYGMYTTIRIFLMIVLAGLIWVPIGVWIGKRPRWARVSQPVLQFLAAFPAYIVYPFACHFIQDHHLDPNVWLSPLLVMGTQWYILFNVIVAVQRFPKGIEDAMDLLSASRWIRWHRWILPGLFPMLVIGLNNAAGGAWNASIEAEMIIWGEHAILAEGLGSYIRVTSENGQLINMIFATLVMCFWVTLINRILWMPLIHLAQRHYQFREEV